MKQHNKTNTAAQITYERKTLKGFSTILRGNIIFGPLTNNTETETNPKNHKKLIRIPTLTVLFAAKI